MLAFIGYFMADLATRLLPAPLADRIAVGLARAWFAVSPPARRRLEANLARLQPRLGDAERRRAARATFEQFALSITDFLRLPRLAAGALDRAIEVRGAEHLEHARACGRGVILLTVHAGNWEWGAAWLAARVPRLHVVARPHQSRWVEALYAGRRRARGVALLARAQGARPLWPAAASALRRREWVAVMGDRPGARGSACTWAAALARRTGALVLPAVMLRISPGRYAACFEPPLSPAACAEGGMRAALRPHVEGHPAQWFAFEPLTEGFA